MDWLIFKYKKPVDGMVTSRMDKGMRGFAYLFLAAFLWMISSYENASSGRNLKKKPSWTPYDNDLKSNVKSP